MDTPLPTISDSDIARYLETCNSLLEPYTRSEADRQMLALAERILANQVIGLEIYTDDPDRPCRRITLQFTDGRFRLTGAEPAEADVVWKISCDKMQAVAANPRDYIDHPEKQDWSCLVSRLGLHPIVSTDEPTEPARPADACDTAERTTACVTEVQDKYHELVAAIKHLQEDQSALVTSTKMSCLADFVSAVAHEVNTPVGVINSAADSLRRSVDKLKAILEQDVEQGSTDSLTRRQKLLRIVEDNTTVAVEAAGRITDLVRRLKRFAHHDEAEYQPVDLHEGIEAALGLLQHRLTDDMTIHRDFSTIPMVKGYPNKLNEMFLSLLRNAVRAVQKVDRPGEIRITTEADDDTVSVAIADNGPGIPSEKRKHLFDFAFTTRRDRIGVQTGLSSSYNIVKLHGGDISVESTEGAGTTVTVTLPVG
ncbi:hypothetical protein GF420_15395 [candidate division GN15 bacterium]|nr:hypothetical protein [candidate division GN15 bacterium]